AYLLQAADLEFERGRANLLSMRDRACFESELCALQRARDDERARLRAYLDAIATANEPTILPEGSFEALREINQQTFTDFEGISRRLLADHELEYLMIRKGNLDDRERREI